MPGRIDQNPDAISLRGQALSALPCTFRSSGWRFLALALSFAVAGCNSDWISARDRANSANTQAPGPGYRADIVAFMRTYLNDPTGVRDAFISEPALRSFENAQRYTLCL